MDVSVVPARSDQAAEFLITMGRSFGFDLPTQERVDRFKDFFEWDRSRVAYDGETMVGTAGAFSLDMTVPGATMRCGGTTVVSVLPTHRRRGILRAMMDSHLEDVRERGEPVAALWASDSAIYGRFGFGCASESVEITVDRQHGAFHRLAPHPVPVRHIEADQAGEILPGFFDRIRRGIPGFFERSREWWDNRNLRDEEDDRDGATRFRYAVTGPLDEITGYVQYRVKSVWNEGHGEGEVRVVQLLGSDPGSWAGLWRFVLDHDLITRIKADHRSSEDPLLEMLAGRRRAKVEPFDALYLRIMDIPSALGGRSYSAPAQVTVEVADPLTKKASVWRLDLAPEGAEVTATDGPATAFMDLEDLGACFMGWSRFRALAQSGRITGSPHELADLDRAFSWSPQPWCPETF